MKVSYISEKVSG